MTYQPLTDEERTELRKICEQQPRVWYGAILDNILRLLDENEALRSRVAELLALSVKLTRETPYPEEAEENRQRVGVLTAEVGTLRARIAELNGNHTGEKP